jgi:hypothetical protein
MCKEMPVIPVDKGVDPKRIIGKKWRAKEEERHKGWLTQKTNKLKPQTPITKFEQSLQRPHISKLLFFELGRS